MWKIVQIISVGVVRARAYVGKRMSERESERKEQWISIDPAVKAWDMIKCAKTKERRGEQVESERTDESIGYNLILLSENEWKWLLPKLVICNQLTATVNHWWREWVCNEHEKCAVHQESERDREKGHQPANTSHSLAHQNDPIMTWQSVDST